MAMIKLIRRHTATCKHKAKGANFTGCRCPIWASGTEEGIPVKRSLKTRDMERAATLLRQRYDELRSDRKTVADARAAFLRHMDTAEGTIRNNTRVMENFVEFCTAQGLQHIHHVKTEHIYGYRESRTTINNRTWTKELEILRHFFRFCVDAEWTAKNPAKAVKAPKIRQTPKTPYTREDFTAILAACDKLGRTAYERQRARAVVLLMRFCGLSVVDVATLRLDETKDGYLHRARKKTGEVVRLPLPPVLLDCLRSLPVPRGTIGEQHYHFWSGNGTIKAVNRDITRTLSRVFQISGVPNAHAHKFRHTLATELLEAGASFEDVATILGSSPQIIRKHYAQWSVKRQELTSSLLQTVHSGTILGQTRTDAAIC